MLGRKLFEENFSHTPFKYTKKVCVGHAGTKMPGFVPSREVLLSLSNEMLAQLNIVQLNYGTELGYLTKTTFVFNDKNNTLSPPAGSYINDPQKKKPFTSQDPIGKVQLGVFVDLDTRRHLSQINVNAKSGKILA